MKKVIAYFIRYYKLERLFLILITLFGIMGYFRMQSSLFPEQPIQFIIIEAAYRGASPLEMEEGVVTKIEDNLKGVTGIEKITSISQENFATIRVELQTDVNPNRVLQDIQNEVDKIATLPPGLERLVVYQEEILNFTASFAVSGDVSLKVLKETAREIEEDFLHNGNLSKIALRGFPEEEIEISVRENDLRAFGISFEEIAHAVRSNNLDITAGIIRGPQRNIIIRAEEKAFFANELHHIVVRAGEDGSLVRLQDVATIQDRWAEDPERFYLNGKRSVIIEVNTTNEEDLLDAAEYVKSYIAEFNQTHPLIQATLISDGSKNLRDRLNLLVENGIMGAILVLIFLGCFLNLRVAFYVAIGIPLSFLGMFIFAAMYGITINLLSLFGMIIVLGILVDDGVVVGENIYQKFEDGLPAGKAAIEGTWEVLPSITSGVLTTIIAFSLFFFVEGRVGDFFSDISFVVIVSLFMSLIEVFFFLPPRLARSNALSEKNRTPNKFQRFMDKVMNLLRDKSFMPVLEFVLANKIFSFAIILTIFILSVQAIGGGFIRSTFFPQIEMDRINVTLELPPGTNDTLTEQYLTRIEQAVWQVNQESVNFPQQEEPVIVSVEMHIGPMTNQGQLVVNLLDPELRVIRATQIASLIRQRAGDFPEAEKLVFEAGIPFGKPISVSLSGRDFDELRAAKEELKSAMRRLPELTDVIDNEQKGQPEIHLSLRPEAKQLGLTLEQVVGQVRQGFFGQEVQRLQRGIDEVIVWVRYDIPERRVIADLENMRIRTPQGEFPLVEIANLKLTEGLLAINHRDGRREINVEADISSREISVPEVTDHIRSVILPEILTRYPGINANFEGQFREFSRTLNSVFQAVPAVFLIMIAIIIFTFKSFSQTFVLLAIIPFALIGAAWGHFIHGLPVSIFSMLGFIALIGIMVNDGIVFINTFNDKLKEGISFSQSLHDTGLARFRPIFLTTITTIGGLGPLILNPSIQAQFLIPMAITVAYGLLVGSILTLTLLPVFLYAANNVKVHWKWLVTGRKPAKEDVEHAIIDQKYEKENLLS
jgi:multidrug efflux pump subunit AcrB